MNFTHLANAAVDRMPSALNRRDLEIWLATELENCARDAVASVEFKCPLRPAGVCEGHMVAK